MVAAAALALAIASLVSAPSASASGQRAEAVPIATEQQLCADIFGGVYAVPNSEPLARCQ